MCSSGGGGGDGQLRLSNIYADHMVFQVTIMGPATLECHDLYFNCKEFLIVYRVVCIAMS